MITICHPNMGLPRTLTSTLRVLGTHNELTDGPYVATISCCVWQQLNHHKLPQTGDIPRKLEGYTWQPHRAGGVLWVQNFQDLSPYQVNCSAVPHSRDGPSINHTRYRWTAQRVWDLEILINRVICRPYIGIAGYLPFFNCGNDNFTIWWDNWRIIFTPNFSYNIYDHKKILLRWTS